MRLTQETYERFKKNNRWVYLVHAQGTNRYKIGRSGNPVKRLDQLQGQSPYPLVLEEVRWSPDSILLESKLHEAYNEYRAFGEWFEIDDSLLLLNFEIAIPDIEGVVSNVTDILCKHIFEDCLMCGVDGKSNLRYFVKRNLINSSDLDQFVIAIDFLLDAPQFSYLLAKSIAKLKEISGEEEYSYYHSILHDLSHSFWMGIGKGIEL